MPPGHWGRQPPIGVGKLPTPMLCCLPRCAGRPGSSYPNVLLPAPVRWAVWSLPAPMLCCLPRCTEWSGRCLPQCAGRPGSSCPDALNGLAVPAQCTVSCPNRVERRVGTADGARCYWTPAGTGYAVRPTPGRGAPPEASSVAKWTPPLPASCSACVRHEKPSARYTAPGSSSRAGSSDSPATPTDTS